ncbi:MAG: glycosyltransferase family 4 protein [Candidatus Altiarchaeota archaeon]|nr:glycosyltransferase family 4 protein [Candidatus Altiarchaeota archaeon]
MKILITASIFPPEIGGPATYAYEFSKRVAELGHKVRVVTLTDIKSATLMGVEVSQVKRSRHKFLRQSALFSKILEKGRSCDVIYAQNPAAIGLPSVLAGKILRRPVVVKYVGDSAWEKAFRDGKTNKLLEDFLEEPDANKHIIGVQRQVFKKARRIIVPSRFLAGILKRFYKVPESRIRVIPNAVHLEELARVRKKRLMGRNIITVCRLVRWKGVQDIIRVLPEVLEEAPDTRLLIVGEGPYKEELEKLVDDLGLKNKVKFLGRLPHREAVRYIASANLFVLNSLYEGMPHVLIEAMAVGTPVVATGVCGIPEIVEDGKNGVLVKPNSKKQLRDATIDLLMDREKAEKLAEEAKDIVKEYSWSNLLDRTLSVLEEEIKK